MVHGLSDKRIDIHEHLLISYINTLKNLEIGVSTKFLVTARIRGNVILKMSFLHIYKMWKKNFRKKKFEKHFEKKVEKNFEKKKFEKKNLKRSDVFQNFGSKAE